MLEDEFVSMKIGDRRKLGEAIKNMVANRSQHCHRKNCTPLMLQPFWRLTISLNDNLESLMVLPPLDEDIAVAFPTRAQAAQPSLKQGRLIGIAIQLQFCLQASIEHR